MFKIILTPFVVLSATGLLTTIIIHLSTILKISFEHYDKVFFLAIGVFVVWFPTVLISTQLTKDFKRKDFWKAALRGCPKWLRRSINFLFIYAIFNFIYMINVGPDENEISTARFISGHLLPFYSAAVGTLYSAIKIKDNDNIRRCEQGHPVSPSAKFCEECGSPIQTKGNR
ncbi:MAG: zinc ribbon domain-containing protein [Desulfobacter sp.]|nr:MAG: zinc ribbon domain-containing protein [Desulfobacter sp.]